MIQPRNTLITKNPMSTLTNQAPIVIPVPKPVEPVRVEKTTLTEPVVVQKPAILVPPIILAEEKKPTKSSDKLEDFVCDLRDLIDTFTQGSPVRYDYEVRDEILALLRKHKL